MKIAAFMSIALIIAGCMMGDPRTTNFENKSGNTINVFYTDKAFDMSDRITIENGKSKDLYPNYLFKKLDALMVYDSKKTYSLDAKKTAQLATVCPEYCTLTYLGRGKLKIRKWEGYTKTS